MMSTFWELSEESAEELMYHVLSNADVNAVFELEVKLALFLVLLAVFVGEGHVEREGYIVLRI